jgi:hypothetical protein
LVLFFSVLVGLLIYWLLGFLVKDIGTWPGPAYRDVEQRLLDPAVVQRAESLAKQIEEARRGIEGLKVGQEVLRDSAGNSERTMNQLLEIQRLALQQGVKPTPTEQQALADSERLFLAHQTQYQQLSQQVAELTDRLRDLEGQQRDNRTALRQQREPVDQEFQRLMTRHNWKLAALKLSVLLPLLLVTGWLFIKMRRGLYAPLIHALGLALLAKTLQVMHAHFPTRYFKYILIGAALLVAARILVYLLRMMAFPKPDWLLKQYREAYESFLCPICGFPIRRGPLKYVAWNRRSLRRLPISAEPGTAEEPYVCPVCTTRLFEECGACHRIRHSLLPACSQCGQEKPLPVAPS